MIVLINSETKKLFFKLDFTLLYLNYNQFKFQLKMIIKIKK